MRAAAVVLAASIMFITHAEAQTVKRTSLPNGLVIITQPSTANAIVSVVVSCRMGSLYETDSQAGLATLMQDTILKGTETRTSEEIALELEKMGTRISSGADREYGTVSFKSTAESLYPSLDILFDIVRNASFPEDAVDLQKQLQMQDITIRNDQPLYRAVDLMVEAHYGDHPFHKPRLGYPETVAALGRDDLAGAYRRTYVPNNMVVTAAGNFDRDQFVAYVTNALGGMTRSAAPSPIIADIPSPDAPVEKTEYRETAASWFALGWPSASYTDPDYYNMEVLDAITGGSMNSRLFVAIREKRGLAYQVASFVNPRINSGLYAAYIGTRPESYEEARNVLVSEVRRMGEESATPEEIRNAKNFLKGMHIMSRESNDGQAAEYGHFEVLGLGYDFADKYGEGIDAVSDADILAAGGKYLMAPYSFGGVLAGKPE